MSQKISNSDLANICLHTGIDDNRILIAGNVLEFADKFEWAKAACLDQDIKERVIEALCSALYKNFYIRSRRAAQLNFSVPPSTNQDVASETKATDLVSRLKAANTTVEAWDLGWEIYHFGSDGRAYVKRGDQSRIAWAGTYMLDSWMGGGAKIGDTVKLKVFPFTDEPFDSFFHCFGAILPDQFDEYKLLRFYFNIEVNAVEALLRFLSEQLNRYLVPYHFKALADTRIYDRADAAVLYIASCHYPIVAQILSELPELLGDGLHPEVPMFTRKWAKGIGAAQDPGNGASFGMHRCRLVAQALFEAWSQGKDSVEEKMSLVEESFIAAAINLNAPYLNPGEFDLFAQPIFSGGVTR